MHRKDVKTLNMLDLLEQKPAFLEHMPTHDVKTTDILDLSSGDPDTQSNTEFSISAQICAKYLTLYRLVNEYKHHSKLRIQSLAATPALSSNDSIIIHSFSLTSHPVKY